MPPTPSLARKAVSWLTVALGTQPGLYGLLIFGQNWTPEDHVRPDWTTIGFKPSGLWPFSGWSF